MYKINKIIGDISMYICICIYIYLIKICSIKISYHNTLYILKKIEFIFICNINKDIY